MIKKILLWLFIAIISLGFIGPAFCQSEEEGEIKISEELKDDLYAQIELYSYALTTVQSEYAEKPTAQQLIYGSLKGMLSSLDPHSQFLEPEDYKNLKTETRGKFGGLGIQIAIRDGLLTVITPLEDTPAWKAGIMAGDKIVKIEDDLTRDITLDEAVKKLRGKPGSEVTITVLREKEFKIQEFTITREIIHIEDVKDVRVIKNNIGYIRLTEFREDTSKEFAKALEKLKKEGADSLILDLRNNPGGLLNVAIKITENFLPEGTLIVSTKGRRPSQNTESVSKNLSEDFTQWPMVVLINEGSASGSEILAGALQDNKRAVIVGTKSFGKGSVQTVIPLPDGSGLRLTTSKYLTPSGKSIHEIGITPDLEVKREYAKKEDDENEFPKKDLEEIFNDVEINGEKSQQEIDQEKLEKEALEKIENDNQIQSAINILSGIKVYTKFSN